MIMKRLAGAGFPGRFVPAVALLGLVSAGGAADVSAHAAARSAHAVATTAAAPVSGAVSTVAGGVGTFYGQPMTAKDIYTAVGNGNCGMPIDGSQATSTPLCGPLSVTADAGNNLVFTDGSLVLMATR